MRTLVRALVVGVVVSLLLAGIAYAHSRYVRSEPGAEAIVASAPTRVDIWFSQEVFRRKGENTIRVTAPDGSLASVGDTTVDDDDRTHIWVQLRPDLPPGVYEVNWRNVSVEDGHPYEDTFRFTIDPQAAATSTPMNRPAPSGQAAAALPTPQPAGTISAAEPSSVPTAVPTAVPTVVPSASGGLCGSATAPVAGVIGFFVIRRNYRRRSAP
jgi:methionine-rich copper-binding protein CopC